MTAEEELIKSIKKKLTSGYPSGELKNELLEKGHTEEDIERLFYVASGHSTDSTKSKTRKNGINIFTLIGVGLLITAIAITAAATWLTQYIPYLLLASGVCFAIGFYKAMPDRSKQNL